MRRLAKITVDMQAMKDSCVSKRKFLKLPNLIVSMWLSCSLKR